MNENIKNFRNRIAELEKKQKELKPQRKTVYGPKDATVSPYEAADAVKSNKHYLRMMYAAYGLMRGKGFSQTESAAKPLKWGEYYEGTYVSKELDGKHPLCLYLDSINDYLEQYGYKLPYEEKETRWGGKAKTFDYERIEATVCAGEQKA
jgi:hypothetical protein